MLRTQIKCGQLDISPFEVAARETSCPIDARWLVSFCKKCTLTNYRAKDSNARRLAVFSAPFGIVGCRAKIMGGCPLGDWVTERHVRRNGEVYALESARPLLLQPADSPPIDILASSSVVPINGLTEHGQIAKRLAVTAVVGGRIGNRSSAQWYETVFVNEVPGGESGLPLAENIPAVAQMVKALGLGPSPCRFESGQPDNEYAGLKSTAAKHSPGWRMLGCS